MNIDILRDELTSDPLARGYAGMSDQQAADSLNTANRTVDRGVIAAHEAVDAIVAAEWLSLADVKRSAITLIVSAGQVNVANPNVQAIFANAFGAGTATRANLIALKTETVSRAVELGLNNVRPGTVAEARA